MKVKYKRLSKEERKQVQKEYFSTSKGIYVKKKLRNVLIYSVLILAFGIYLLIDAYVNKLGAWQYVYGYALLLFSAFFFIGYLKVRLNKLNEYVINNKKGN